MCTYRESDPSYVSNERPENIDRFEHVTHFDTWDDANTASMLLNRIKQQARIKTGMSVDDKQLLNTIDKLAKRVDELIAEKEVLQAIVNRQAGTISSFKLSLQGARNILEHAFAAIARDLVLENTHRARNELYRAIA